MLSKPAHLELSASSLLTEPDSLLFFGRHVLIVLEDDLLRSAGEPATLSFRSRPREAAPSSSISARWLRDDFCVPMDMVRGGVLRPPIGASASLIRADGDGGRWETKVGEGVESRSMPGRIISGFVRVGEGG